MIGNLYDGRVDKIVYGANLWKQDTLKIYENDMHSSKTSVVQNENVLERMNGLDIDASLKLSFMGGLVSVNLFMRNI